MKKVLIVDDDEGHVYTMSHFMRANGFETAVAMDGLTAVMQATKNIPDLIILDFEMPAGDGGSVYQRLKSMGPTVAIPIIFVSGLGAEEVRKRMGNPPGNVRFLSKPVDISDLAGAVAAVLPGSIKLD